MKIVIIGYTAAGKSQLALKIAEKTGYPLLHLDKVHFASGWQKRDLKQAYSEVENFIQQADWIVEGNYHALNMQDRYAKADYIIFLNYNRFYCLFNAIKRALQNKGKQRRDLPDGCYDHLNPSFIFWILINGRTKKWRNVYQNIKNKYNNKFITLNSNKEADKLLNCRLMQTDQNL